MGTSNFYRHVLLSRIDSHLHAIRGGLIFNMIWGKAPLADKFAAPAEKDPVVDVNAEVQRRSTARARRGGHFQCI
jgi:hypothetical protein